MPSKPDRQPKPKPFRPYWDACVLISAIQRSPDRIGILDELIALNRPPEAKASDEPESPRDKRRVIAPLPRMLVYTSSIIAGEVIKAKDCEIELDEEAIKQQIKAHLEVPWITRRTADDTICEMAGDLRRQFGIKLPDAIHLATALRYEVDELHTYDPHLLKRDGVVSFESKPGTLIICNPRHPIRMPLFKDQ